MPYSNIDAAALRDVVGGLERLAVVLEVEAVLDPLEQLMAIGFGDAEQDADRLHRQLAGDRRRRSRTCPRASASSTSCAVRRRRSASRRVDRARRQALAHEQPHALMARVVHHVEHHPGDRQVGDRRAAVRAVAAGLRRERVGIVDHGHALGVRVHRPEPFAVGRVRGRLVPQTGAARAKLGEDVVREAVGELVEIGQIDRRSGNLRHRSRTLARPHAEPRRLQ